MKSSKTSFLRNCISGWNVRAIRKRMCGAYVYDCFVTFVLVASTDNVSYSKTMI